MEIVPDCVGLNMADTEVALLAVNLEGSGYSGANTMGGAQDSSGTERLVTVQVPKAGETVPEGTNITLTFGIA